MKAEGGLQALQRRRYCNCINEACGSQGKESNNERKGPTAYQEDITSAFLLEVQKSPFLLCFSPPTVPVYNFGGRAVLKKKF
jgi:hypothetical protein